MSASMRGRSLHRVDGPKGRPYRTQGGEPPLRRSRASMTTLSRCGRETPTTVREAAGYRPTSVPQDRAGARRCEAETGSTWVEGASGGDEAPAAPRLATQRR